MLKLSLDYLRLFAYFVRLPTKHKFHSRYLLSYMRVTYSMPE